MPWKKGHAEENKEYIVNLAVDPKTLVKIFRKGRRRIRWIRFRQKYLRHIVAFILGLIAGRFI